MKKSIYFIIFLGTINYYNSQTVRVIDNKGTIKDIDQSKWEKLGNDIHNKNSGNVGIGISIPTNSLHISSAANPLRLEGLQTGATTDKVLTTDASGVVRQMNASAFVGNVGWLLLGNSGIIAPAIPATYGSSNFGISENWLGNIDAKDLVFGTTNLERMRLKADGSIGIGTATTAANTLLTVNPTTNAFRNGISMNLTGATSTATGINISANSNSVNGMLVTNQSNSITNNFYGVGSILSSNNIVSGYLGYRNGAGLSYGIYGINGTNSSYALSNRTWAAFLQGRTVISSEVFPSSDLGVDLEIRNTTANGSSPPPATLSMRQTTSVINAGNVLANMNFGDNYITTPQAQVQVVREAASSGVSDLPTAFIFSTITDGTATLSERMRINNTGFVGIGTNNPSTFLHVNSATSPAFRLVDSSQGAGKILISDANGNASWTNTSSVFKIPISNLLNATAINTIDNTTFAQTWNWSTATTENPLSFTANSLTTGSALNINTNALTTGSSINVGSTSSAITSGSLIKASGNVQATTTNGLFNISNTAASSTGVVAKIQANNTANSGLTVLANGNVSVGTTTPTFTTPNNSGASIPTLGVDGTVNASNYTSPVQALATGSTYSWDLSKGENAQWTLNAGANTLSITNVKAGMYGLIRVINNGTSTIVLPSGSKVVNGGGGIAILTQIANAVDILTFFYDGTNYWWTIGNNYN